MGETRRGFVVCTKHGSDSDHPEVEVCLEDTDEVIDVPYDEVKLLEKAQTRSRSPSESSRESQDDYLSSESMATPSSSPTPSPREDTPSPREETPSPRTPTRE